MCFVTLETLPAAAPSSSVAYLGANGAVHWRDEESETHGSHCQGSNSSHLSHLLKCHHEPSQRLWGESTSTSMKSVVLQDHEVSVCQESRAMWEPVPSIWAHHSQDVRVQLLPTYNAYLIQDHPVGVNLGIPFRVQDHSLVGPEVGQGDLRILRAHINVIDNLVLVEVRFADISYSII